MTELILNHAHVYVDNKISGCALLWYYIVGQTLRTTFLLHCYLQGFHRFTRS